MNVPKELEYTKEHEWVAVDGRMARIGITDYAQGQLGDIVYVELPEVGAEVTAAEPFGSIEAVKAVSDLFAPVSGVVKEINSAITDSPELVNSSPYGEGWMIVVETGKPEELEKLMSAEDYEKLVETESP
ncbi:MAG: glycine cleavage system protein GcvH [Candidatus Eisenbacteria sp.]|nr:glycine cleavage system protein GcvH [Candidatus Eisenbacteria bacterium]